MPVIFSLVTKDNKKIDIYGSIISPSPQEEVDFAARLQSHVGSNNERTNPDSSYNCHGLTFIGKAGNLGTGTLDEWTMSLPGEENYIEYNYDSNSPQNDVLQILRDSRLRLKTTLSNLLIDRAQQSDNVIMGDIVIYKQFSGGAESISHSGIVSKVNKCGDGTVNLVIWSKMGIHNGEYFHRMNDPFVVETYGSKVEIWSDSKI